MRPRSFARSVQQGLWPERLQRLRELFAFAGPDLTAWPRVPMPVLCTASILFTDLRGFTRLTERFAGIEDLASLVVEKGAHMLDSPVSGSVITLEQGNLSLMVGGDEAIFEQAKPVLLDIGPKVTYVGKNGQAVLMKIAINLNLQTQFVSFCEGLLLAIKGGVPVETALDVMLNSVIASPSLKYRTPFILNMPEEAWFNVNMMQKDMLLAEDLGRELNVALPTVAISKL